MSGGAGRHPQNEIMCSQKGNMDNGAISLAMVVRDEAECLERAIQSVIDYVDEAVFLDTGSVDGTADICAKYGHVIRLNTDYFDFHFGQAKTAVSWMARGAFILLLDADEVLTGADHLFDVVEMMDEHNLEAVAFPRRRWLDYEMTIQVEKEAYPDWQVRLYRNDRRMIWRGALHETLDVQAYHLPIAKGIEIQHFVDSCHLADPTRAEKRLAQRTRLARKAKVPVEGSLEAAQRAGAFDVPAKINSCYCGKPSVCRYEMYGYPDGPRTTWYCSTHIPMLVGGGSLIWHDAALAGQGGVR